MDIHDDATPDAIPFRREASQLEEENSILPVEKYQTARKLLHWQADVDLSQVLTFHTAHNLLPKLTLPNQITLG